MPPSPCFSSLYDLTSLIIQQGPWQLKSLFSVLQHLEATVKICENPLYEENITLRANTIFAVSLLNSFHLFPYSLEV